MILTVFIFFTFSVVQNLKKREISQNHAIIESMNSEEIIEPYYTTQLTRILTISKYHLIEDTSWQILEIVGI